jgi:hypothetical protein
MTFARRVFFWAGIYGLLAIVPGFFNEPWIAQHQPPPITHPEFFYGFYSVALAFQVLFLLMARDPVRYRALMPACMLEKFGFFVAATILFTLGRTSTLIMSFAVIDCVLGLLFIAAYVKTKPAVV